MTSTNSLARLTNAARFALASSLVAPLVMMTGCGLGKITTASPDAAAGGAAITGKTFGGPNPIIGATVKLYTTGNSDGTNGGYGVATLAQEATSIDNGPSYPAGDTDVTGSFSFAGGYSCPAGQFAYLVSSGGNTGSSSSASGATATATFNGVTSIAVTAGGTLYTGPIVTITNDPSDTTGSGAAATATQTSGVITKITVTAAGNGYTLPPIITITDATTGTGATATATIATGGAISSIPVTAPGSGYYAATVTITPSDANGSGATGTAIVNPSTGAISSIKVTNAGSGYDAAPVVTVANGAGGTVNPANTNAVLVAALGRCEDLYTGGVYTGSPIYINELTTVAAAYALGHFSTVSGTGAATVISIGAPATNNAAQVSGVSTGCVAGVGSCTTTATAGLAHAFQNAANLVNVFPTAGGANTTKTANSTVSPAYGTYIASYSGSVPLVPTPVINAIANSLISCVNSAGGVANDGSACGTIFKLTTLPAAVAANYTYSTGTTAPTNTFSAMVNLAANPSFSGSSTNVLAFYNVAGTFTSIYTPTLAAAPATDFTIAINYPAAAGGTGIGNTPSVANSVCGAPPCQGLSYVTTGALDINDNLFVGNPSTSGSAVPVNVLAFGSNGKLLSMSPNTSGTTGLKYVTGLSVDATGYGYFGAGSASTANNFGVFTTGFGSVTNTGLLSALTTKTLGTALQNYGTAVDRANNVWASGTVTGSVLYEVPAGAAGPGQTISTFSSFTLPATLTVSSTLKNMGILVDPNQNIWVTGGPRTAANLNILENTGTVAAPTYANGSSLAATTSVGPTGGITFAGSPYVAYIGGYNTTPGIDPWTPTFGTGIHTAQIVSIADGTSSVSGGLTGADLLEADGTGALYIANHNNSSITTQFWASGAATGYKLNPCVSTTATAATACASVFSNTLNKPQWFAIDSAGSAWVGSGLPTGSVNGALLEIIGTAAPTVPLLSLGKPGLLP